MDGPNSTLLWTWILLVTALGLLLLVGAQIVASYSRAYMAAPQEVATFLDAADFSIQENESYDRDVARVPRLEDKIRLGRLLREIQKAGDDLREDLNKLLVDEDEAALKMGARILWAGHRKELEDRMRRLDLLRMRFLVVYMGILSTAAGEREKQVERAGKLEKAISRDAEKAAAAALGREDLTRPATTIPNDLVESINESIKKRPALRRLTQSTIGHSEKTSPPHRVGWLGVVHELQMSPRLKQRHQSIEAAMRPSPLSPSSIPPLILDETPSPSPRARIPRTPDSMSSEKDSSNQKLMTHDET